MVKLRGCLLLAFAGISLLAGKCAVGRVADPNCAVPRRSYKVGDKLEYQMKATNENRGRTTSYRAIASGVVKQNAHGVFFVDFTWSRLSYNGHSIPLPSAGSAVQEQLSLDPQFRLRIPDLSTVPPVLLGPMTDLLTFYADAQLAMRQHQLCRSGDHVSVKHPQPNPWADHIHTLLGEDAIDFEIALLQAGSPEHTTVLLVKHTPPSHSEIHLPAAWMRPPVHRAANNWVQVLKQGPMFIASVGEETFMDRIVLSSGMARYGQPRWTIPWRSWNDRAVTNCSTPVGPGNGIRSTDMLMFN